MTIIKNWTALSRADYGHKIQAVEHGLAESGLFTDDALAALLDRHPSEKIDVCTMNDDPLFPHKHCTVDFRGFTGAELVAAAKDGHIWINIREAMTHDAAYKPLMQAAYEDLERCTGKDRLRRNCRGGILISSPSAKVPYHCDPTMTLLWYIRGKKRVFVYPVTCALTYYHFLLELFDCFSLMFFRAKELAEIHPVLTKSLLEWFWLI